MFGLALAEARSSRRKPTSVVAGHLLPGTSAECYSLQPNVQRLVDTGETRWVIITDDQGFRTSRTKIDKHGGGTVLCLGDSFTFGHGVDYEQTFVGLLDADTTVPYRFVNAAIPGHGPVQYEQVLEYLLGNKLDVDRVLVTVFLGNDFTIVFRAKSYG